MKPIARTIPAWLALTAGGILLLILAAACATAGAGAGGPAVPAPGASPSPLPEATASPGTVPAPSPTPDLQDLDVALASGDSGKALAAFQTWNRQDRASGSPESRLILANLLLSDRQLDKARDAFQSVLEQVEPLPAGQSGDTGSRRSTAADAHYGLYLVALNSADPRAAKGHLDQALAINPDHGGALCAMGQIALANKNYVKAAEYFDRSLAQDPGNAVALQGKASALARTDRVSEAVNLLCDLLKLQPDNLEALADRGRLYAEAGHWEAALKDLGELVRRDPGSYLAWLDRGRVLVRAGRPAEAAADFSRVLELEPKATLALAYRGQAWWMAGRTEEARADLEQVLKTRPGYPPALEPLAQISWQTRRWTEAAGYFEALYDPQRKNEQVLALAVGAQLLSGDKAALKTRAERALPRLKPDSPAWVAVRFCLDPSQEGTALEVLKTLKPGIPKARYQLEIAIPLHRLGRKQTCINILKDVIDFVPADSPEGRIAAWMMDEYQR